ncbi:Crp/Fnr family transcriptional regulator [Jannaschia sp. LMIT008]|uniref:Crp/Fnr family transcriptional regulator n=1 Tax=Jannaschia maritima TaxID=3032585 RepID=UPI002811594A|nr:Crp/Fnr family transcriptional regulator [Jannaschia sp. LMIT008]
MPRRTELTSDAIPLTAAAHPGAGPGKPDRRGLALRITDAEWRVIRDACAYVAKVPAKTLISRKGEALDRSLYLMNGIVGRHVPGPHRDLREMVALEVPGDFVDLHSFPVGVLDHDVTAMTDVELAVFPHANLRALLREHPDVALTLWAQTVVDAAIHRYWSFRVGALRASARVANFVCELHSRLTLAGLADADGFDLPLTQTDLGEACGMSPVHVNRVIRELREAECCTVRDGRVTIVNHPKLVAVGQYEADFLDIWRGGTG